MMTCFTRIVVVFHFLRQALGTQGMPANQLLVGLALFLTFYIMMPGLDRDQRWALQPYLATRSPRARRSTGGCKPIRTFMLNQVREKDLSLFVFMSQDGQARPPRRSRPWSWSRLSSSASCGSLFRSGS